MRPLQLMKRPGGVPGRVNIDFAGQNRGRSGQARWVPKRKGMGLKWFRRTVWLLVAWAIVCAALWLALPWWLKPEIEKHASEALGREVRVDRLDIRPWSLVLGLRGVRVGGTSSTDHALLTVDEVQVDADLRSLWERAPVVSAVVVRAPKLRLARVAEGRYDIDDLLEKFALPADATDAQPARFALYNLQLVGGEIHFDDQPVKRLQQIKELNLSLPFLSNLPTHVDIKVEPRLRFLLNGSAFDSGVQTVPFAQQRSALVELHIAPTDLTPYVGYLPNQLPVRLKTGMLQAHLNLQLEMPVGASPRLHLKGDLQTKNFSLTDAAATPLLAWQRADLKLLDIRPFAGEVHLGPLEMEGLDLVLSRPKEGPWNWVSLAQPGTRAAPEVSSAAPPAAGSGPKSAGANQASWRLSLKSVALQNSVLTIDDAAVKPVARMQVRLPELELGAWTWPLVAGAGESSGSLTGVASTNPSPTDFNLRATLHTATQSGSMSDVQGKFRIKGRLSGATWDAGLDTEDLLLPSLAPYVNQMLQPRLAGRLTVQAQAAGRIPLAGGGATAVWSVKQAEVTVSDLRLTAAASNKVPRSATLAQPLVAFKELSLKGLSADSSTRILNLGDVVLSQPKAVVHRDEAGAWNTQRWLVEANEPPLDTKAATSDTPTASGEAWQIQLARFQLKGGDLDWLDASAAHKRAVELQARSLQLQLQDAAWQNGRLLKPVRVRVDGRLSEGGRTADRASRVLSNWAVFSGQTTFNQEPLQAKGQIKAERFPAHVFAPYAAAYLPVDMQRADLTLSTDFNLSQQTQGWDVQASGQLALANLEVFDWPDTQNTDEETRGNPLISWQRLSLDGVRLRLSPGGKPDLEVAHADLTGLVSRLVITEEGRFNLRDVAGPRVAAASASVVPLSTAQAPVPASAASDAMASTTTSDGLPLRFSLGGVKLINATVDFADRFIRPNYSAKLTELHGSLGTVRSDARDMAPLVLKGKAAGTALIDIAGHVNPMVEPLALDINAKASDLELAPLTAYAAKYAGYAIERGKLSLELQYKIDPAGRLEATNQLILNQLTFGDRVDSPTATKLPVLLAVSLLKDKNGVIDINLPVSGSLQDPEFSVGGIIWKVVLNLLGKALTAPFSLLAGGGSTDLSVVEFVPGTAVVTDKGQAALNKVAQALIDRPSLRMTVAGVADPMSERDAFAQAAVQEQISAEQRRELARAGSTPQVLPVPSVTERAALLRRVYRQTDMPGKPRTALGLLKELPADEMEALLKSHVRVSVEAMRELALQRGLAVRQTLADKGLPGDRLFLAAPKLRVSGEDDAAWLPSVQLTLATR
jgi:hypothetical protein